MKNYKKVFQYPKSIADAAFNGVQKTSLDQKVKLNCDGELHVGVKLGDVSCFTVFSHRQRKALSIDPFANSFTK